MEKILEKIDSDKEVLSTLPKNNKKNITQYVEEVEKLQTEYSEYKTEVFKEMKKRYDEILSVKESDDIEKIKVQLKDIENMLNIIDTIKTSYEKMGMDSVIYKLGKFYKANLEDINQEILKCINKFKEVGIELTPSDFDYSIYVTEYMTCFFDEAKKQDVYSDIIKNKFEEIYWKCPDIIIHIELNLRYIFLKKQNIIDKYYDKKRENLLSTISMTPSNIQNKYMELNKELANKVDMDKAIIINKFFSGKLSVKDYTDDKIKENYKKMISAEEFKDEKSEEINENIIKFINSLYEYKNYDKFKFIYEDVKKKYVERETHKNDYTTIKKTIATQEKKLNGLNKKINGKSLFGKKKEKVEKQSAEYNRLILDIKENYKKLDEAEIYKRIVECLTDESTIYDTLNFATSFNTYLVEYISDQNKDMEIKEVKDLINELKNFLKNPYNTIIKNITILEEKDIQIIISDRYKLLNFNINKDDVSIENADSIINVLSTLETKYNMDKVQINLEDLNFICEFKKILDKQTK